MFKKKIAGSPPLPFNPDKLESYYNLQNLNFNNKYQTASSTGSFLSIINNKPETSSFSLNSMSKGGKKLKKGGVTVNINSPLDMNSVATYFDNSKLQNKSSYMPISSTGAFQSIVNANNQGSSFALQKGGIDNIINKNFKKFKKGGDINFDLKNNLKDIYNINYLKISSFPKSGLIDSQLDNYGSS